LDWCTLHRVPFIYASSAATYGDGAHGFVDDFSLPALRQLRPMNLYGWSKHLFDLAVIDRYMKKENLPPHWAGLKFFNVYGPNEYHKGGMQSVLAKVFDSAKAGQPVKLFKSHKEGIADGDQRRDFIYVDDVVAVTRWLLDSSSTNGIFNVGTGKARSFRDMIISMFKAMGRAPNIEYVDMPENIRGQYQYFTQGSVENLRSAGYNAGFTPLETAVGQYVTGYLNQADRYK
jgi:ADP-L-glycero-D-manno-heptose 6-epimerase